MAQGTALRVVDVADPASIETPVVGPEQAREWVTRWAYEHQRPLSRAHVGFLVETMQRGEFAPYSCLQIRTVEDARFIVDGQHRLEAVAVGGVPQRFVVVTLAVPDMARVALDYGRFDRGRMRHLKDVWNAYGLGVELDLSPRDLQSLAAGSQVIAINYGTHHGVAYSGRSGEQRVRRMREWAPEMRDYATAIQGASTLLRSRLQLGAVTGVALMTLRHATAQAAPFWRAIALNDGLRADSPERALVEFLLHANRHGRPHEGTLERAAAKAWNAYYDARPLAEIGTVSLVKPIVIAGTPVGAALVSGAP